MILQFIGLVLVIACPFLTQVQCQAAVPLVEEDFFNFQFLVAEDSNKVEVVESQDQYPVQVNNEAIEVIEPALPPVIQENQYGNFSPEAAVKAAEIPQVGTQVGDDEGYGEYADALVNCTDIVPQEQIDNGFENCSQVIESINSFQNLGLEFPLCQSEVVWRWGYCQKTCGLCQECEDNPYPGVSLECNTIQSVGLCEEMDIYQNATYCARSCQTCQVLAERQGGSGCSNAKTVQCDADSLLKFKSQMSEAAKEDLSSWIQGSNPCIDNWKGISCNVENFRVTKVQLGDYIRTKRTCSCWPQQVDCSPDDCHKYYNSTGALKDTLFTFQESNSTYVSGMYTSIPSSISQMVFLEVLELVGSELTGQIPVEMSMLSRMQHLVLFDNKINGTIPSQFSTLSNMQSELHLGSNDLTGTIPEQLSTLNKLWGLYLSDNYFSGRVPEVFSVMGEHLYAFNIEPQYDDKLCILNTTAEYLEGQVQMETDAGQLTIC